MYHIIYLSWAVVPFTNAQLQRLLTRARRRNTELAITGILLYGNEQFVQVLEGEEDVVRELYGHIRQDERHTNFITFADKTIAHRSFKDWAMAFHPVSTQQFDDVVGYLSPCKVPAQVADFSAHDNKLFDLLRSFVQPCVSVALLRLRRARGLGAASCPRLLS